MILKPKQALTTFFAVTSFVGGVFIYQYLKKSTNIFTHPQTNIKNQLQPIEAQELVQINQFAQLIPTPLPSPTTTSNKVKTNQASKGDLNGDLATPKPTPKPTSTSTPLPDIFFRQEPPIIVRHYNDGSSNGNKQEGVHDPSTNPHFEEISQYWESNIQVCTYIQTTVAVSPTQLTLDFTDSLTSQTQSANLLYPPSFNPNQYPSVCVNTTSQVGTHSIKITINPAHKITESNYQNNQTTITFTVKPDTQPPTFTISGPNKEPQDGTCLFLENIHDNVSLGTIKYFLDGQLTPNAGGRICVNDQPGSQHTFKAEITDQRSNKSEQSKTFTTL